MPTLRIPALREVLAQIEYYVEIIRCPGRKLQERHGRVQENSGQAWHYRIDAAQLGTARLRLEEHRETSD